MWSNEGQPDRVAALKDNLADFTASSGIKTKVVALPEDQLATLLTNAAAAGKLPDVVAGVPAQEGSATRSRASSTPRRRSR